MRNGLTIVPRNTLNRNMCHYLALTPFGPPTSPQACSELLRRNNLNVVTLCLASAVERNDSEHVPFVPS
jgi:hypothetical protein